MMASLPTSKDHIPASAEIDFGCVNIPESNVNAFVISPNVHVTASFSFPSPTYIYGGEVDEYEQDYLDAMNCQIDDLGVVAPVLLKSIRDCVKQATNIRRKYLKWL